MLRHRLYEFRTNRCSAVAAVILVAGPIGTSNALGPAQAASRPAFEVASVKPGDARHGISVTASGRRFVWENIPLSEAIIAAYHIGNWQLAGAPDWINTERFTIQAVTPEGTAIHASPFQDDHLMMMLQSLLENRFKLKFHWQTKEAGVYALVVAKSGPKLKVARDQDLVDPGQRTGMAYRRGLMTGTHATMTDFTRALSVTLERPVSDKTNLTGIYDFVIEYSRADDDGQPSLLTALQEQLGLRLESQKGQAQIFVVDHVERPEAN
jgi:uncharacterized protein (TIGR03435 family)